MFPRFDADARPRADREGHERVAGSRRRQGGVRLRHRGRVGRRGEQVILVRRETNPDDLRGMVAARGILTSRGGKTSHAAVVARGMGRTCVCGADSLTIDVKGRTMRTRDGVEVAEGDPISIDGTTGEVFSGEVPVVDSLVVRYFEGDEAAEGDELVAAVARLMEHADSRRRLAVRANADTPDDAARSRRFGAQGIGLCRTEHMFLGDRKSLVENLILAESADDQEKALAELLPMQRDDFVGILEAMDGLPVTIRLIDPPLHEFLPDYTDLSVEVAVQEERGDVDPKKATLLEAVKRLHEENPMLGLRGVRLGIVIPGLFAMQARAILEAAAQRIKDGGDPQPEIMIPLVGDRAGARAGARRHRRGGARDRGVDRRATGLQGRHDDRAAPRRDGRRRDRRCGGVLLLRHQRPHPDDVGLLPRRRRGLLLLDLPREGDLRRLAVRVAGHRGGRRAWSGTPRGRVGRPAPTCTSGCAASTAATRTPSTSSTRSGSTTCPARPSGSRWRGSRRVAPPPASSAGTRAGRTRRSG